MCPKSTSIRTHWNFYSPARGAREIYKSCKLIPAGFFSGCGAGLDLVVFYKVSLTACDGLFFCYARGGQCHTDSTDITDFSALLRLQRLTHSLFSCSLRSQDLVYLVD